LIKALNKLTKMTDLGRHKLWAELAEDSCLDSLRYATLGWVKNKRERIVGVQNKYALCVLLRGQGSFFSLATGQIERVRAPGVFFVSPGVRHDYGPTHKGEHWEELYWILEGSRVTEWVKSCWWVDGPHFWPVKKTCAAQGRRLFEAACAALMNRNVHALDRTKLKLEQWLAGGPWAGGKLNRAPISPLAAVVERWRCAPAENWSLPAQAKVAGLSYSRFRARFLGDYGLSPHAYLQRLRLDLAARWLRSTDEPVKAVAGRCGFGRVESFIRAFAKANGCTPARWRAEAAQAVLDDRKLANSALGSVPKAKSKI
jgi:AraC-like DNA-binding protein